MPASKTTKKKSTKKSTRTTTAKKKASTAKAKSSKAGEKEVKIDRRQQDDRREEGIEEETIEAASPAPERRQKVQRRRQIDPTTCERDYSDDEVEFMNAMDEYKRTSGRMFPTCSEVLEVIRDLGYFRLSPAELALKNEESSDTTPVAEAVVNAEDSTEADNFESSLETREMVSDGWTV